MFSGKSRRIFAGTLTVALLLSSIIGVMRASASTFAISQDGPYVAVDPNFSVGTGEWRLNTHATAGTNTNSTTSNASLIFAYVDAQNYYYANYATAAGTGLSGVYRVSNGVRSTITTYSTYINAGQSYELELRHKTGDIRIYLGSTQLYKATNVTVSGTKIGVATINSNASFDNTLHNLSSVNTPLSLSFDGGTGTPSPTAPTVSLTAPANNATVSGTQTVTADAADAVAVTSVQFKLDGNNLGVADTTPPYSADWDTTTATNAGHSLTAVATNQAALTTTSSTVAVTVNNQTTPPPASDYTLYDTGPNAGIDTTRSTTGYEWRLSSHVTPIAGNGSSPANFAFVFNYTDAQNYYYVDFTAAGAPGVVQQGLSGVYRVTNGTAYKLLNLTTHITTGQAVDLEVRYKDNAVRLYLNGTYLTKAENITGTGNKVGVATFNATAGFSNTQILLGSTSYPLTFTDDVLVATPENPYACLPTPSTPTRTQSTGRQVAVTNSAELKAAILDAQPGDTITMANGTYTDTMVSGNYNGSFAITADGTASNPITLIGTAGAIIDGDGTGGRYGLYMNGANYWNLVGFTVTNASKGIVTDHGTHNFLEDLHVTNVGQEAVHFRAFSSDNVIINSHISATGRASEQFGEGVYIGSANGSNWAIHTGGLPDTSDRNIVIGNTFTDFTAEAIDVKEGTSSNYIANNYFEGSSLSGQNSADSWIDLKGRCNFVQNNTGDNTLLDAFQIHNVFQSWASYNLFRNNTANVNAPGYGFALDFNSLNLGNLVECNNVATNAASGLANIPCTVQYF